jgi:hypothetical protein
MQKILEAYTHKKWYNKWVPRSNIIVICMKDNIPTLSRSVTKHPHDVFFAFNGKNLSDMDVIELAGLRSLYNIKIRRHTKKDHSSLGSIGCSLSHILVWNKINSLKMNGRSDKFIILESDAEVQSWDDMEKLCMGFNGDFLSVGFFGNDMFSHGGGGTSCYIVTREFAGALMKCSMPCTTHIDFFIKEFRDLTIGKFTMDCVKTHRHIKNTGRESTIQHPNTDEGVSKFLHYLKNNLIMTLLFVIIFLCCRLSRLSKHS